MNIKVNCLVLLKLLNGIEWHIVMFSTALQKYNFEVQKLVVTICNSKTGPIYDTSCNQNFFVFAT